MNNVKLSRSELAEIEIVRLCSVCLRLGQCRDESVLYTSASTSFHFTLNHNQAHCVLEKNRTRVDYTIVSFKPRQMENNDRTLKELATPYVVYQPWCIQYPQLEPAQTYELKYGLIHLLPKFHGLAGEDPHKHLKEFHVVFSTMRPQGISEDYIKMK
ncbi:hypothetical protein CR513_45227, partial [Mucuna pruriens]